jgi:hypothetical protein
MADSAAPVKISSSQHLELGRRLDGYRGGPSRLKQLQARINTYNFESHVDVLLTLSEVIPALIMNCDDHRILEMSRSLDSIVGIHSYSEGARVAQLPL